MLLGKDPGFESSDTLLACPSAALPLVLPCTAVQSGCRSALIALTGVNASTRGIRPFLLPAIRPIPTSDNGPWTCCQ